MPAPKHAGIPRDSEDGAGSNKPLTGTTATVLTFSEPQTAACVAGTVTFTRHGADLTYRWTDNIGQNLATLRKA
jgi:hypothetical protein